MRKLPTPMRKPRKYIPGTPEFDEAYDAWIKLQWATQAVQESRQRIEATWAAK